jgi:ubiquinone/menaquinone biosynthesis C-methylase UbiE
MEATGSKLNSCVPRRPKTKIKKINRGTVMNDSAAQAATDNTIPIEAWNTVLFDKFIRFRALLTDGLASHSNTVLPRLGYQAPQRVLDVGCGFGDTTQQIAAMLAPGGRAVGVDCAPRFIETAEAERRAAGIRNAKFLVADVQTGDLGGPYDHAFSRFGTMFFNLPGAALRNIRRALKPGGTLPMIVWRKREDNPFLHEAELLVREIVPVVSHEGTDAVHCGPGPFSMAGPDLVSDLLRGAGFERIRFERLETDVCVGRSLDEAIEFAMALGPAGEIIRLAGAEGEARRPQVVAALRGLFGPSLRDDGIWGGSSSWVVTAANPGG